MPSGQKIERKCQLKFGGEKNIAPNVTADLPQCM